MAEGWDLSAVVRSCTASPVNIIPNSSDDTNTNTHAAPIRNGKFDDPFDYLAALTNFENEENLFSFPDLVLPPDNGLQELQDSLLPFFPRTSSQANIPGSSISDFGAPSGQNQPPLVQQQLQQQQLYHQQHRPPPPPQPPTSIPFSLPFNNSQQLPQQSQQIQRRQLHQQVSRMPEAGANVFPRASQSSASRSRKKKSNQKRLVMHVAAENLGNDVWAWRKYGQKPIKGSPYPRNYYRCSSSKGCSARKQVERNHADPTMYIVSYTGDHTHPRPTHRNSLAGSTRNKIPTHQKLVIKESEAPSVEKAPCSSPLSGTSLSPTTPLLASMDHEAANESMKAEAGNMDEADMEGHGIESDVAGDGEDDGSEDDENILIPNMTFNEDLIKDLQQLNRAGDGALNVGGSSSSSRHGFGRSQDFGDNFTNWARGNSAAAARATGGGGR